MTSVILLVVMVVVIVLVRKGRAESRSTSLEKGERIRPIAITLIDPVISLLIIGTYLWRLATSSVGHMVAALVGAAVGIGIGALRARVMYVRAVPETKSIVLRRSGLEYGLVGLLVVLRLTESSLHLDRASFAVLFVSALAGLGLAEAIARSVFIVLRYLSDASKAPGSAESPVSRDAVPDATTDGLEAPRDLPEEAPRPEDPTP